MVVKKQSEVLDLVTGDRYWINDDWEDFRPGKNEMWTGNTRVHTYEPAEEEDIPF